MAIQVGDKVTFFFWAGGGDAGSLHSCPAIVKGVHEVDDGPQALELDADIPEQILASEGYVREQTHSRQRPSGSEDDIHASGTWS